MWYVERDKLNVRGMLGAGYVVRRSKVCYGRLSCVIYIFTLCVAEYFKEISRIIFVYRTKNTR